MNEKRYEKKIETQQKLISIQSKQIEDLKLQVQKLKVELAEKDEIVNSVIPLRDELTKNVIDVRGYKKEYKELVYELRKMKEVMDKEIFKGKWKFIKLLIK